MTIAIEPRMKAGPLRNGWERGHGSVFHAVPVGGSDNADALCGTYPSIMWSSHLGAKVTCPRCLKKLAKNPTMDKQTAEAIAWLLMGAP
jgi:hypothetical protein